MVVGLSGGGWTAAWLSARRPKCRETAFGGIRSRRSEDPSWSSAGDEGDDGVGGVTVEVLAAPVVHGGGSRVGVAGGELDVA